MSAPTTDIPTIRFVRPIPGFPELRDFALVRLDDDGVLCELRSLDGDTHFLVAPPQVFVEGYAPQVAEDAIAALELDAADDAVVLGVVTVGKSLAASTINLAAPIVVNVRSRLAAQVLADDADSDAVRTPLAPLATV
ncbi:flagellar assembly protein FliW [Aeromicrobium phragmitis]|uniref:Flagellar assembly factor FliW n=1 Tax=Aeromicrobium phragmitis TaxID=2478914 RepID=A0A3L8PMJ5_9ACTN|nr:flagellar assembly protein FliW [Aeromicrobium phragmitis]RLV56454.1 flagellar assembly protein FliW [Aeromicrobium phragmitis]